MKTILVHVGIDPATELLGLCVVDQDGSALPPLTCDGEVLYGYRTFKASGKTPYLRVDKLKTAIEQFMFVDLAHYFDVMQAQQGDLAWSVATITLEQPAMRSHQKTRHDAQLVLGMPMYMVWQIARDYISLNPSTLFYESEPRQSSVAVGAGLYATKTQRNTCSARMAGGQFLEGTSAKGADGHVVGGNLHGANPDALDAFAAAQQGRKQYIEDRLLALAKAQEKENRRDRTAKK